jgi:hypothetical protein
MSLSLARNNVSYTVRLRTPQGRRVGFFNGLWGGEMPTGMFVTEARWSNMPPVATLFEKVTQAQQFRKDLLNLHLSEIRHKRKHLTEQEDVLSRMTPANDYYANLLQYTIDLEKELAEAIEMVPYIENAEIVRIVVETA